MQTVTPKTPEELEAIYISMRRDDLTDVAVLQPTEAYAKVSLESPVLHTDVEPATPVIQESKPRIPG